MHTHEPHPAQQADHIGPQLVPLLLAFLPGEGSLAAAGTWASIYVHLHLGALPGAMALATSPLGISLLSVWQASNFPP